MGQGATQDSDAPSEPASRDNKKPATDKKKSLATKKKAGKQELDIAANAYLMMFYR